jgi:hypothetical protein
MSKENKSQRADGVEWHGMYRAKVTEVDIEGNDYGAVRVFVPALMFSSKMKEGQQDWDDNTGGLVAYPANSSMGGYNSKDSGGTANYQANIMVPLLNSWWWVFFEGGDPNRPFYTAPFLYRHSKVPPENRNVSEPHKVYTLAKLHSGRAIVMADSPDVQRIEITGKKREITGGPEGDAASVYKLINGTERDNLPGNQSVIMLDERPGREKFLIKTHLGDFVHIDIDSRKLQIFFKSDFVIETEGNVFLKVKGNIVEKVDGNKIEEIGGSYILKVGADHMQEAGGVFSTKSGSDTTIDGSMVYIQNGMSASAPPAVPIPPMGGRNT